MQPPNITDDVKIQAKLVRAQLLITTHTRSIIEKTRQMYWMETTIHTMQSDSEDILVRFRLKDMLSEYSISGITRFPPTHDIVEKLEERLLQDIAFLHNYVEQREQRHTMHAPEVGN